MNGKTGLIILLYIETHPNNTGKHYLRVNARNVFQTNRPKKQAGVAFLISNKIDFLSKLIKRDREGPVILINGKIYQDYISILNIYTPNTRALTLQKKHC